MGNLLARVKRLERGRPDPTRPCPYPWRVTCDLEPGEAIPPDARRCEYCGEVHAQVVHEEVVEARTED
jgi:hypothetical protein